MTKTPKELYKIVATAKRKSDAYYALDELYEIFPFDELIEENYLSIRDDVEEGTHNITLKEVRSFGRHRFQKHTTKKKKEKRRS